MRKTLDKKLERIREGRYRPKDFIIADAKDPDMAFGCAAAGRDADGRLKPIAALRGDIEKVCASGLVDVMLMSLSSAEALAGRESMAQSGVTAAIRLNDASDIWFARGAAYKDKPAAPFRSARVDRARAVADLGLYAVTFYNDLDQDRRTLDEYARFRDEASAAGMRHFLEVFNPHFDVATPGSDFASYNNDMIARCLAGVSRRERPLFLKAAYNGPKATEEIAAFDPENLVFGILGGGAGTTRDCLELLRQAEKYGARVALFGRKIYYAEDSVLMIAAMRRVIEEGISSHEGVKAYHADLGQAGVRPFRDIEADLELTEPLVKANAD